VNHGARDRVSWKLAEADDRRAGFQQQRRAVHAPGAGKAAPATSAFNFGRCQVSPGRLAACRAARLGHPTNVASPSHPARESRRAGPRPPCPIDRLESSNLRRQRPTTTTTSHAGSVAVACTNHWLPSRPLVHGRGKQPNRAIHARSSSPGMSSATCLARSLPAHVSCPTVWINGIVCIGRQI
jgi:hypothetical protein